MLVASLGLLGHRMAAWQNKPVTVEIALGRDDCFPKWSVLDAAMRYRVLNWLNPTCRKPPRIPRPIFKIGPNFSQIKTVFAFIQWFQLNAFTTSHTEDWNDF
jgi:hypothetical protein